MSSPTPSSSMSAAAASSSTATASCSLIASEHLWAVKCWLCRVTEMIPEAMPEAAGHLPVPEETFAVAVRLLHGALSSSPFGARVTVHMLQSVATACLFVAIKITSSIRPELVAHRLVEWSAGTIAGSLAGLFKWEQAVLGAVLYSDLMSPKMPMASSDVIRRVARRVARSHPHLVAQHNTNTINSNSHHTHNNINNNSCSSNSGKYYTFLDTTTTHLLDAFVQCVLIFSSLAEDPVDDEPGGPPGAVFDATHMTNAVESFYRSWVLEESTYSDADADGQRRGSTTIVVPSTTVSLTLHRLLRLMAGEGPLDASQLSRVTPRLCCELHSWLVHVIQKAQHHHGATPPTPALATSPNTVASREVRSSSLDVGSSAGLSVCVSMSGGSFATSVSGGNIMMDDDEE
eukprot:PhM_4_TR1157/c0_g1_i1/m.11351